MIAADTLDQVLSAARAHVSRAHQPGPFIPGQTLIHYAGRVFDSEEVEAATRSIMDFGLTLGERGREFETALSGLLGRRATLLCNSGSSANLLALAALTSPRHDPARRLLPGDEVITAAAGFPTTVFPIVQLGAVPVFIDSDPRTGNIRPEALDAALSPRTKAVMLAHTLGNPFDLGAVVSFCRTHQLWLVEDNCDALGSRWCDRLTGFYGDLSTQSYYPAHHITMGEGGSVSTDSVSLRRILASLRDWGRDCWCRCGESGACGRRHGWQLGDLPAGFDHKYTYSHLGYNLKPLDLQAAIGLAQLRKLDRFCAARRANWQYLRAGLDGLPFSFMERQPLSDPSWFGFMIRTPHRRALADWLEQHRIETRALFGGNLVRQPVFTQLLRDRPGAYRIVGDLAGADTLMREALFVGVYPGLTTPMLDYMIATIRAFRPPAH